MEDNKKPTLKTEHEKLKQLLGEPFDEFFRALEAAERKLAAHTTSVISKNDDENAVRYLKFMAAMMATKAGVYAATAAIGYTFDPAVAYEGILHAMLAGLNTGVSIHRKECTDPTCDAPNALVTFLAEIAEAERVADQFALVVASAPGGKPVVN